MQKNLHTIKKYSVFVVQNSKHNPSKELKRYAKELFDILINQ